MLSWKITSCVEKQKGISVAAVVKPAVTRLSRSSWLLNTYGRTNVLCLYFGAGHAQPVFCPACVLPSREPKRPSETQGEEPQILQKSMVSGKGKSGE